MDLVGAWVVDETDAQALERWGNVVLEFDESGGLIYTICGDDKDEIIILRYQVEGSTLITDQPSAPQVERTQFSFTPDGVLILDETGFLKKGTKSAGVRGNTAAPLVGSRTARSACSSAMRAVTARC